MRDTDPLEVLRLAHSQWSSRYLDQIDADDYPGLLETMDAAIAAWEKERAMFTGRVPYVDRTLLLQNAHKLQALRAEVLKVAEDMMAWPGGLTINEHVDRLRKACE